MSTYTTYKIQSSNKSLEEVTSEINFLCFNAYSPDYRQGDERIVANSLYAYERFLALLIQGFTGFVLEPELQGVILMMILFGLRMITKEQIVWE